MQRREGKKGWNLLGWRVGGSSGALSMYELLFCSLVKV